MIVLLSLLQIRLAWTVDICGKLAKTTVARISPIAVSAGSAIMLIMYEVDPSSRPRIGPHETHTQRASCYNGIAAITFVMVAVAAIWAIAI